MEYLLLKLLKEIVCRNIIFEMRKETVYELEQYSFQGVIVRFSCVFFSP